MLRGKLRQTVVFSLFLLALAGQSDASAGEGWKPSRTVNIYCWSTAGGISDLACRALAASFKEQFDVPFNVSNMVGGGGGITANHVYNAKRDGLSIIGGSDAMHGMGVQGAFAHRNDVWEIMMLTNTAGLIGVRKDSPYQTLGELLEAAKTTTMKAGASQAGCVWYVKLNQVNQTAGVEMNILPYEGSSASIVALLSGEIDVVLCGLSEQEDYVRAGQIRPLAIVELSGAELPGYGSIPSVVETLPEFKNLKQAIQWAGLAIAADTPEEIRLAYREAFKKALTSEAVQNLKANKALEIIGITGEEAAQRLRDNDSLFAWTIYDAGLAVKSPEEFGIPKP